MAGLSEFQEKIGVHLDNPSLLKQALVHTSYTNENPGLSQSHNERLEYLGDAVLGLIIAEKLYHDFPTSSEGEMTILRSALVRRDTLARIAEEIKLGDYLYVGKGEEKSGGRLNSANLAGAIEAVIAAVFLDQGWNGAKDFIIRIFGQEVERLAGEGVSIDYKSRLQEAAQGQQQPIPAYHLIAESGPDHDKYFTVEVSINNVIMGTGSGKNKKLAETKAAQTALQKLENGFTQ